MARKKKRRTKKTTSKKKQIKPLFSDLDPNIKKTIAGVILFTLAIIFGLSLFELSGKLGEMLDEFLSRSMGIGRYFLPLSLFLLSVNYFRRLEARIYLSLWIGLILMFFSFLGLIHIFYDIDEIKEAAANGEGGGFTGYLISFILLKAINKIASIVILVSTLIIGTLIVFNSQFAKLLEKVDKEEKRKRKIKEREKEREDELLDDDSFDSGAKVKVTHEKVGIISFMKDLLFKIKKQKDLEASTEEQNINKEKQDVEKKENPKEEMQPIQLKSKQPKLVKSQWFLPPTKLLDEGYTEPEAGNIEENSEIIETALLNFGITAKVIDVNVGPTVTQYAVKPAQGVRLSKIVALQNDLAMALAAHPLRIEAPIPGKSLVGIEVPNKKPALVRIRSVIESEEFKNGSGLVIGLGEDAAGKYVCASIDHMPHLLIAGATGAGKSIGVANVINSLVFKYTPDDLRLILVDPKRVELSVYNGIPHLLTPVIVDIDKVVNALKWAVNEMERRYKILQKFGSRDLYSYAEFLKKHEEKQKNIQKQTKTVKTMDGINHTETVEVEKDNEDEPEKLPFIVIIIDELADIMVSHGKEVEVLIVRIAQKARAVGIHLILSTQRPSVQIITGIIKANIPARIAYQVASQIDSRTILDMAGAEKLLGKGDMLFLARDTGQPKRIQGAFIQEDEVKRVADFLRKQAPADYNEEIVQSQSVSGMGAGITDGGGSSGSEGSGPDDDLFEAAKETVIEMQKASATLLQRKLRVGYARAARIMEMLEEEGVIGPANGSKPREILMSQGQSVDYNDPNKDQEKRDNWQA